MRKNITYNAPMELNGKTVIGLHSAIIEESEYESFMAALNERGASNIKVEDLPDAEPQPEPLTGDEIDFFRGMIDGAGGLA